MSKTRIESKWYHESPNFRLVAVDALSLADQYVKVALFELRTPAVSATPAAPVPVSRRLSLGLGGVAAAAQAQAQAAAAAGAGAASAGVPASQQYSVDIGTNIAGGSTELGIGGSPSTHSAKV
jgi:hypothetical protein